MADVTPQTNRTLIVTGASRGIGAAIAQLAAKSGFVVAVNYRERSADAESVVQNIQDDGGNAVAIQADVAVESDILRLFTETEQQLGPISALVNNAAITGGFSRVDEVVAETIDEVLATNVRGTLLCCREAVRRMSILHGGNGGAIVNLSSLAWRKGSPGEWVHYAMTKGAISTLTVGLAREVAAEGIRVNAIAPGLIDTEMAVSGDPDRPGRVRPSIPMQRLGSPAEVAEGAIWLLSPAASFVTGTILEIGGGS